MIFLFEDRDFDSIRAKLELTIFVLISLVFYEVHFPILVCKIWRKVFGLNMMGLLKVKR
jgi:hypothetical protein